MSAGSGTLTATAVGLLIVGEQGTGTLDVGGASVVNARTLAVALSDGTAATGTVLQTGGTVNASAGVAFGGAAAGTAAVAATYTLGGGTLSTPSVSQGTAAGVTGLFHFAGGTLAPTASTTTLMQGLTTADVRAGGAVFDTGGFAVTVAQPLVHNTASAAVDGGLTKLGTGTLTLAGLETYTGPTNAAAGVLTFAAGPAGGGYRRQLLPGGLSVAGGRGRRRHGWRPPPDARAPAAAVTPAVAGTGSLDLPAGLDVPNGDLPPPVAAGAAPPADTSSTAASTRPA